MPQLAPAENSRSSLELGATQPSQRRPLRQHRPPHASQDCSACPVRPRNTRALSSPAAESRFREALRLLSPVNCDHERCTKMRVTYVMPKRMRLTYVVKYLTVVMGTMVAVLALEASAGVG